MKEMFLLIMFLSLFSCISTPTGNKDFTKEKIDAIAIKYLGKNYFIKENSSKSFSIAITKHKNLIDLFPDVHFIVIKNSSREVILEDKLKQGSVNWYSDTNIIAIDRDKDKDSVVTKYYYDVLSRTKVLR